MKPNSLSSAQIYRHNNHWINWYDHFPLFPVLEDRVFPDETNVIMLYRAVQISRNFCVPLLKLLAFWTSFGCF